MRQDVWEVPVDRARPNSPRSFNNLISVNSKERLTLLALGVGRRHCKRSRVLGHSVSTGYMWQANARGVEAKEARSGILAYS